MSGRLLAAIIVVALLASAGVGLLAVSDGHTSSPLAHGIVVLVIGWSFVASGLVAWARRPDNRTGAVLVAVGFAEFLAGLKSSDSSPVYTVGVWLALVYLVGFVYLLLAFPEGRLRTRLDRTLVGGMLGVAVGAQLVWLLFADTSQWCGNCPPNAFQISRQERLATGVDTFQRVVAVAILLVAIGTLIARWRRATPALRRATSPVLLTGSGALFVFGVVVVASASNGDGRAYDLRWVFPVFFALIPLAFLAGLLRRRLARAAVASLMVELRAATQPGEVRNALARALGDPSLELGYWLPDRQRYLTTDGEELVVPRGDETRAATVVECDERRVGVLVHDRALDDEPELVDSVCAAAAFALENERLEVDLRARLDELHASRGRIVEAADAERRRIERNLHDGAQQRLASAAMAVGLAKAKLTSDPVAAEPLLDDARQQLVDALEELRELSHGVHPPLLTERGLEAAVRDLATHAPVATGLDVRLGRRPPQPVEAAAYYVVSEGLANLTKHAGATAASVRIASTASGLLVEIADDGVGGADVRGSGLRGLADRVEALGGRLTVVSPRGKGTVVRAELPCTGGNGAALTGVGAGTTLEGAAR